MEEPEHVNILQVRAQYSQPRRGRTIRVTHHPAIHEHDVEGLRALRIRLRQMRDKERTLTRHKQRALLVAHLS